ncbi:hypothetical protein [Paludifilum halophilum]|uniref:Uncharacterized protein n=1 Tax=Paludifilum halophilum TaxID=1642702 RepID=A0A235B3R1_9BACL|nr:hypothetical protein [Paludifilum halophilum]OYD06599.1 hypothetical protein CHM34_16030 [Paludifilum halophilum]
MAQYGDDALALGKKAKGKLDDALSKGKKKACACPKKRQGQDSGEVFSTSIKWKGFRKGSLAPHYEKHGHEFGDISQSEYLKMAKGFATESGSSFKETKVGNFIIKYDPNTRRTLIGHQKSREIRTFYKADYRDDDPFEEAVRLAKELSGK